MSVSRTVSSGFYYLICVLASTWYRSVSLIFFIINCFKQKTVISPVADEILLNSAVELARKIRSGEVTSEEIVQACIKRINETNKILNVVVECNFENALNEARRVDQLIASGSAPPTNKSPFLGVPFTNKDSIMVNGMLCTCGIPARRRTRVFQDADVVANMKQAGAIFLAITNVSEVCMFWESNNPIYGRSNNPYDIRRSVGGSSGGEAALQAAAGSIIGIGSDIGGSIRIPSAFNGVFGHKPTAGVVSTDGLLIAVKGFRETMLSAGPICRYAEDLWPTLQILAGPNIERVQLHAPIDFGNMKIFYMNNLQTVFASPVDDEINETMKKAIKYFEKRYNSPAYKLDLPIAHLAAFLWTEGMHDEGSPPFAQEMCNREATINPCFELMKFVVGQSRHTLPAVLLAGFENFLKALKSDQRSKLIIHLRGKLQRQLNELLSDNAVLFLPPSPTPAPYHNQSILMPFNFIYCGLFNALALPVTQCPMGLNKDDIPLGVQIVGATNRDRLTIAVAQELEKAFGGWVPKFA